LIFGNDAVARADGVGATLATIPFVTTVPMSVGCWQAAAGEGDGVGRLVSAAGSAAEGRPGVPVGATLPATPGEHEASAIAQSTTAPAARCLETVSR